MANRRDNEIPEDIQSAIKSNKNNRDLVNTIEEIRGQTSADLYGNDQSFSDENKANLEKSREAVQIITDKYKKKTGEGVLEFFTQMVVANNRVPGTTNIPSKSKNAKERNIRNVLKNYIENPNTSMVSDIFFNEKTRINGYTDYDLICEYIPQLAQALDTYVDCIISPDDFTKTFFNVFVEDTLIEDMQHHKEIKERVLDIQEKYDIENEAPNIIRDTLKYGDCFVATLKLKREFEKFLNEEGVFDSSMLKEDQDQFILSEDNTILSENDMTELHSIFGDGIPDDTIKHDFQECINNNVEICSSSNILLEEYFTTIKDFQKKNKPILSKNSDGTLIGNDDSFAGNNIIFTDEMRKRHSDNGIENDEHVRGKDIKVNVNGSYFKILDPKKIVKISVGRTVFGYFYIDNGPSVDDNPDLISKNIFSNSTITNNGIPSAGAVDVQVTNGDVESNIYMNDSKLRFLANLFGRNLGSVMNKKFIEKNQEFSDLIYELLRQDYIIKRRLRIVFLAPEEVEHFCILNKPYGDSIFKKILFTAKLYLSVLTSTLMMKITRSADHRAFYIETGLSNDVEQTIQGFVRDIKTKEVKLRDLNSVDTIFNSVGQLIIRLS